MGIYPRKVGEHAPQMALQGVEVEVAVLSVAEKVDVYRHAVSQPKAERCAANQTERVEGGVSHQPHQSVAQIGGNCLIMQHEIAPFEGWM